MAEAHSEEVKRRDFLYVMTGAFTVVGAGFAAWPFVAQMNPSASVLAVSTTEVNLDPIEPGQSVTVMWRGKPVFVRHRTEAEIAEAADVELDELKDPQTDADRVQKPEWLVMVGSCTHLGCVPVGQQGAYKGWFCPCHGSHYDTSGRIRKGPAPTNLEVPPYSFTSDTSILIG